MDVVKFMAEVEKMREDLERTQASRKEWMEKHKRIKYAYDRDIVSRTELEHLTAINNELRAKLNEFERDQRFEERYLKLQKRHKSLQKHFTDTEDKLNRIMKILGGN